MTTSNIDWTAANKKHRAENKKRLIEAHRKAQRDIARDLAHMDLSEASVRGLQLRLDHIEKRINDISKGAE